MITLATELTQIRGLAPPFLAKLKKLGIGTVRDLLWHFPTRYDDFSTIVPIASLTVGVSGTVRAEVKKVTTRQTWKRHMTLVEAIIADDSGGIKAIWFNQPYLAKNLRVGMFANFAGKVATGTKGETYLASPAYEPVRAGVPTTHTGRLIPIYPETKGLTSRGIRYLVKPILETLPPPTDPLPPDLLAVQHLPALAASLRAIHFPPTLAAADHARKRFAFEELFVLQLANLSRRAAMAAALRRRMAWRGPCSRPRSFPR